MRAVLFALLLAAPVQSQAQDAAELVIFGAMVEAPEGTPLASATGVGGTSQAAVYLTRDAILTADGPCLRIWAEGPCHPMDEASTAATMIDGLAWMSVPIPQADTMAKFTANPITGQPLVGTFDAATDPARALFVTQNPFGGWERPIAPVPISGGADGTLTLRDPAFTPLSLGAPVVTAEKGLVGVVVRAVDGVAQVAGLSKVVAAASADGIVVPDMMQPDDAVGGGLPPRVESEMGRLIVFADQGSLAWIGGFYGPSRGAGFDESFVATIDFSVWEVLPAGGGTRIAGYDKRLPLVPVGQQLEAPFRGTSPDYLATCIVHPTPSSDGRSAMVLQFWRFNAVMGTSETGFRSFDEAAPPLTTWAEGGQPCAESIGALDDTRLESLFGQRPTGAPNANPKAAPSATEQEGWRQLPTWDATGIAAVSLAVGDRQLTLGCTASRELAIAILPGTDVTEFTIGGQAASDEGYRDNTAYALFPGAALSRLVSGASIGWQDNGAPADLPGPPAELLIGDC